MHFEIFDLWQLFAPLIAYFGAPIKKYHYIAVVFFNQTESADSLHFFCAKLQIDPGNASNALKIGVDPFHYAPNRLRGSV